MPKIIFHPEISSEIKASYRWYQEQAAGLGDDFIAELEAAYEAITALPETWPKFQKRFRRFLLTRFPYSIVRIRLKEFLSLLLCITAGSLAIGSVAYNKALVWDVSPLRGSRPKALSLASIIQIGDHNANMPGMG